MQKLKSVTNEETHNIYFGYICPKCHEFVEGHEAWYNPKTDKQYHKICLPGYPNLTYIEKYRLKKDIGPYKKGRIYKCYGGVIHGITAFNNKFFEFTNPKYFEPVI